MVKYDAVRGKTYLFTYNTTPYYSANVVSPSVTVQFALPTTPSTITVYGENRTITTPAATFSDTFGPFAAHVYVIQ